jgi:hypothetical protein
VYYANISYREQHLLEHVIQNRLGHRNCIVKKVIGPWRSITQSLLEVENSCLLPQFKCAANKKQLAEKAYRKTRKKVKVKQSCYRPGQAQRVDRGIALPFRDLGARRRCVVRITPWPLYSYLRGRPGTHCTGGRELGPSRASGSCHEGFYTPAFRTYLVHIVSFAAAITSLWLSFVWG